MLSKLARCGAWEASQAIAGVLCIESLAGYMVRYRSLLAMLRRTPWCRYSESTVKKALHMLLDSGVAGKERLSQKRVFYYMARPLDEVVVEEASIRLVMLRTRSSLSRHVLEMRLHNRGAYPLVYFPLVIMGDTARSLRALRLRVWVDGSRDNAGLWVYEDTPHTKRVLVRLARPVEPGERASIRVEYLWEEVGGYLDYMSCKPTARLEFLLDMPSYMAEGVAVYEYDLSEPLEKEDVTGRGTLVIKGTGRRAAVSWRGPGPRPFRSIRIQWGAPLFR